MRGLSDYKNPPPPPRLTEGKEQTNTKAPVKTPKPIVNNAGTKFDYFDEIERGMITTTTGVADIVSPEVTFSNLVKAAEHFDSMPIPKRPAYQTPEEFRIEQRKLMGLLEAQITPEKFSIGWYKQQRENG